MTWSSPLCHSEGFKAWASWGERKTGSQFASNDTKRGWRRVHTLARSKSATCFKFKFRARPNFHSATISNTIAELSCLFHHLRLVPDANDTGGCDPDWCRRGQHTVQVAVAFAVCRVFGDEIRKPSRASGDVHCGAYSIIVLMSSRSLHRQTYDYSKRRCRSHRVYRMRLHILHQMLLE